MKKIISLLISVLTVVLCFAGCNGQEATDSSSKTADATSVTEVNNDTASAEVNTDTSSNGGNTISNNKTSSNKNSSNKTPSKTQSSSSYEDYDFDDIPDIELSERDKIFFGVDPEITSLSVKNKGNTARIANLMKRASKGGSYTIAVLGGSISEGAGASSKDKCYGSLVADWWKYNFPKAKFTFVNAGIGATNSEQGVYRMEKDLLSAKPDFVVVDYAVNTYLDNNQFNSYSTILYNILEQSNNPAVMSIYFTACDKLKHDGGIYKKKEEFPYDAINNANNSYDIPAITYHNYIWNKIDKKILTWPDIGADYIHPNDNGHIIAANLITTYLDGVKSKLSSLSTTVTAPKKPTGNDYMNIGYVNNTSAEVVSINGFAKGAGNPPATRGWQSISGKNGELKIKLPAGAEAYLFMRYLDGATGTITVTGNKGNVNITEKNAATPTLVPISGAGNEFTIKTNMTRGTFLLYGIAYKK